MQAQKFLNNIKFNNLPFASCSNSWTLKLGFIALIIFIALAVYDSSLAKDLNNFILQISLLMFIQ